MFDYWVQCENCNVWVHAVCVNMTDHMYEMLDTDEGAQYQYAGGGPCLTFCAHPFTLLWAQVLLPAVLVVKQTAAG